MADSMCGYTGDRGDALISYLYDDIDAAERAAFEAHLATCPPCRSELAALRGVRDRLAGWTPPQADFMGRQSPGVNQQARAVGGASFFARCREIPAWAQVAAAMLVLGVSAGIANLDIRYDRDGLSVRTGWSKRADARAALGVGAPPAAAVQTSADAPWRSDLAAFESRLRGELRGAAADAHATPVRSSSGDDEILRRVRRMIADSQQSQQNELALRLGQMTRDVNNQRASDLMLINRTLGAVRSNTGIELQRQRADINYLAVQASQRQ